MRLILSDGERQLIVGSLCFAAIDGGEMDCWICGVVVYAGLTAHGFGVLGPGDGKDLGAPNGFSQAAVVCARGAIDETGEVGESHFGRIIGRSLGLLGGGII